jgi:hypothetical protein
MRLLFSYTLLLLVFFQGAGWTAWWTQAKMQARVQAEKAATQPEESLLNVVVARRVLEENRFGQEEMWWQGHLYDIRQQKLQGDSVALVLYHDQREEHLFSVLESLLEPLHHTHFSTAFFQLWGTWLSSVYLVPALPQLGAGAEETFENILFYSKSRHFEFPVFEIFSPPRITIFF